MCRVGACRWVAGLAAAWAAGCGYGFGHRPGHVPADARTISVRPFENSTLQIGVDVALTSALMDVIRERGTLRVVSGAQGDLLLRGRVRDFSSRPVGFSEIDRAQQYETTMVLDIDLSRKKDGKVLWNGRGLTERLDAAVTPGIIIPSSPRFQQGALNARDLSGLTRVQQAEDQRSQEVLRARVDTMARSIYSQMRAGF